MAEGILLDERLNKEQKYIQILEYVQSLSINESNHVAFLGNAIAVLHHGLNFFWTGLYLIRNKQLHLSVFQGPVACTKIDFGKGVCGKSWEKKQTIIVDDVEKFEGHIACSSLSKSEIVIPLIDSNNNICGVLDVDSEEIANFDETDSLYLQRFLKIVSPFINIQLFY